MKSNVLLIEDEDLLSCSILSAASEIFGYDAIIYTINSLKTFQDTTPEFLNSIEVALIDPGIHGVADTRIDRRNFLDMVVNKLPKFANIHIMTGKPLREEELFCKALNATYTPKNRISVKYLKNLINTGTAKAEINETSETLTFTRLSPALNDTLNALRTHKNDVERAAEELDITPESILRNKARAKKKLNKRNN